MTARALPSLGGLSRRLGLERRFRAGDLVEVRSAEEILATLDASGRLDGLPFMPEMLAWCGRTLRVSNSAHKTCDTIRSSGQRWVGDAVHLAGARCDGSAHGGCEAACLLFWRDAWIRPAERGGLDPTADGGATGGESRERSRPRRAAAPRAETLVLAAVSHRPDGDVYTCQATEMNRATTPLPWWNLRQYAHDLGSRNVDLSGLVAGIARWFYVMKVHYPVSVPPAPCRDRETEEAHGGDVEAGDRVRVRPKCEIEATLDAAHRERGLSFDAEMVRYCGREHRVLRRVRRIIDERTGRLIHLRDCIVLDDAYCRSDYHRFCPRAVYFFWRGEWLTRLEPPRDRDAPP